MNYNALKRKLKSLMGASMLILSFNVLTPKTNVQAASFKNKVNNEDTVNSNKSKFYR